MRERGREREGQKERVGRGGQRVRRRQREDIHREDVQRKAEIERDSDRARVAER